MLDPQRISAVAAGTCDHVAECAHAWLDDELPAPEVAALRRHVATCAHCAGVVAVEERFLRALRGGMRADAAPDALWRRIRAQLAARA